MGLEHTYRGIIHCHSRYSYDAKLSLSELKALCQKNNIQFVCMTEHVDEMTSEDAQAFVRECEALSDEAFLFIPGFEVPYKIEGAKEHAHILMVGLREFFGNYAPDIQSLKKWTEKASLVLLAHPVRNNFLVDEGLLEEIDALEVWNQQYEGKRVPRTRSLALLGELREKKPTLLGTGGVDFHRTEHFGAPFITLATETLTEAGVIEKLKIGAFSVSSPQASFYGTIPNIDECIQKYRFDSLVSVCVIVLGKFVNATLAKVGIKLPKSLKQLVRKGI